MLNDGSDLDGSRTLTGRSAVVTGANSGIGLAVTEQLVKQGAAVIMACRNIERAETARDEIATEETIDRIVIRRCDLADLDVIESFADWVDTEYDALDLLCNNAGIMAIPFSRTADGFEQQFGVNHLGHFAITGRLLDLLCEADGKPRIVTQSSKMHERTSSIDFDRLDDPSRYSRWQSYAMSKLANVLFARELDRRLDVAGESVRSFACEPGFVATNLQLRGPQMDGSRLKETCWRVASRLFGQSPDAGARPMVRAATDRELPRGVYLRPGGFLGMQGDPVADEPSQTAQDDALANALWEYSVEQTGVSYGRLG